MPARETVASVSIKPSRVAKLRNGYPWIQKEEVAEIAGKPAPGDVVAVLSPEGRVGIGFWNPASRFAIRMLSLDQNEIGAEFFSRRFAEARRRRERTDFDSNSRRVCFAEADGLPGLIVDRYADWLIVQVRSMGMHRCRDLWLPELLASESPKGVLERTDMEGVADEGLDQRIEILDGQVPDEIEVVESGLRFICPTRSGLKTGFYLDQREARRKLAAEIRPGDRVLDVCCYSGGFALYAARAGAQATGIDILPEAISLAQRNADANNLNAEFIEANAFEWLQTPPPGLYDAIILDPPAIAKTAAERDSLKGAVHKLAELSIPRLRPGGRLVVFACSYQLGLDGLLEAVRQAARGQGARLYVDAVTLQPPDHPFLAQFPESLYLKGVWGRIE